MKAIINTIIGGSALLAGGYAITAEHYTGLVTVCALWFCIGIILLVEFNTGWVGEKGETEE